IASTGGRIATKPASSGLSVDRVGRIACRSVQGQTPIGGTGGFLVESGLSVGAGSGAGGVRWDWRGPPGVGGAVGVFCLGVGVGWVNSMANKQHQPGGKARNRLQRKTRDRTINFPICAILRRAKKPVKPRGWTFPSVAPDGRSG